MTFDLDTLDFTKGGGVVTVVTVDDLTGRVLMIAQADREALERTIATGEMHYRSRSRGLWHKGATSGNVQAVVRLTRDCDGDAVLARVRPAGPACHDGTTSCFATDTGNALQKLDATIETRSRSTEPGTSYTARLLGDPNLRLKKIGEESAELVHAVAVGDRARAVEEAADLLYHTLVVLRAMGAGLDDVSQALARRAAPGT
jgi:phosphoribosyl-ATP pyrophosphohydrolase/phosphoribosyl-AMP cyclohydrolase